MSVAGLSRRRRTIIIVAVCVVVVIVAAGIFVFVNSGGSSASDTGGDGTNAQLSAQDTASEFLDGVVENSATDAGQLTTNPTEATGYIKNTHAALKPHTLTVADLKVVPKNNTATVTYTLNWGLDQTHTWSDPGTFTMSQDKTGTWKVNWALAILSDKLQPGDQLMLGDGSQSAQPTVLGGDGSTLLGPMPVINVTLNPSSAGDLQGTATKLSAALSQFDSSITAQSIVSKAGSGGSRVLISLRQTDYDKVKTQLAGLPGVTFPAQTELVGPTKTFASAIMPGIRSLAGSQTGTASTTLTVYIAHADGSANEVLYSTGGATTTPAAPTITTTLNTKLQEAAEAALGTVSKEAMAVIIQPSTGKILAVARNDAATATGDNPLTGLYPPGSTFKIVTAATALSQGKITPQTQVACPGTTSIEGRTISNEDQFNLGTTSVTTAFARSCNTTFSQLAATQLGANDLPAMAKQFGIGVDYQIPGFTTNTGHVPADSDTLARGEDGFGQGQDEVSVFAMALAAATAEHGSTPVPSLIAGETTQSDTPPHSIGSSTVSSLKTLMRAVVTSGTATAVAHVSPAVYGKTGTAQFGDGTHSHGWFVGYQGDMAFAFLIVDGGSSSVAVQVTNSFFANGG